MISNKLPLFYYSLILKYRCSFYIFKKRTEPMDRQNIPISLAISGNALSVDCCHSNEM